MLSEKFSVPGPCEGQAAAFFLSAAIPSQTNEQDRRVAVPWWSLGSLTSRLCRANNEKAIIKGSLPWHQPASPKGPDILLHLLVIRTTPPLRKQTVTFHGRITGLKLIICVLSSKMTEKEALYFTFLLFEVSVWDSLRFSSQKERLRAENHQQLSFGNPYIESTHYLHLRKIKY